MTRTVKKLSSFQGDLIEDQVPEWAPRQEAAESQGRDLVPSSLLECWAIEHIGSTSFAHSAAVDFWVTFVHNCVQPRSRQWCQMTLPSVVLYGWWAVPGRTREGEAIPLEGWQESLRGAKMSPKIGWVTAMFPLGHVTGFVHFVLVPLTQKKMTKTFPFLSAPESR